MFDKSAIREPVRYREEIVRKLTQQVGESLFFLRCENDEWAKLPNELMLIIIQKTLLSYGISEDDMQTLPFRPDAL